MSQGHIGLVAGLGLFGGLCCPKSWWDFVRLFCFLGLVTLFALRFRFGRVWVGAAGLLLCPLPPVAAAPLPVVGCYGLRGFVEVL